jgi:predicted lysophospholipase L1 biosynthesis ABC-type transport system permease subunit
VGDVRSANLSRVDPAYVYLPTRSGAIYDLLVRSDRGNAAVLAAVRHAIAAVDEALARTVSVTSIRDGTGLNTQLMTSKLLAACAAGLACLALVLVAVGIYSVAAFYVGQRTREIGIRMALGARPAEVRRLVVRQAVGPVLAGSVAGLAASLGIASILRAMLVSPSNPDLLFGIPSFDPVTFLGIPMFLAMVAALASYVPARRAVKVDLLAALRSE